MSEGNNIGKRSLDEDDHIGHKHDRAAQEGVAIGLGEISIELESAGRFLKVLNSEKYNRNKLAAACDLAVAVDYKSICLIK
ncbi:hypothetical protein HGA64_04650 [Candidatus Falkowbacteria bacterium]|nr:hypothetical protein [Candidatus Falkowbacteria bacterium]